jgi:hypothetical protein
VDDDTPKPTFGNDMQGQAEEFIQRLGGDAGHAASAQQRADEMAERMTRAAGQPSKPDEEALRDLGGKTTRSPQKGGARGVDGDEAPPRDARPPGFYRPGNSSR